MIDAFKTNGSSPPARRHRLKLATWTIVREPGQPLPRRLDGPTAAAEVALEFARAADDGREHFWCVLLDAKLRYVMHTEVSVGTLNASLVHPRDVFGPSLREGAASLILAHNHPSGDPTPSREDVRLTRQLVEAGKLLDVPIHDHIVVGNGTDEWVSLAQHGAI
jgi:DNA repair protein RadC